MGISILGTGRYLPEKIVTNHDFTSFLDTDDEWIVSRTGIKQRHIADGELTFQMGAKAAAKAIEAAGLQVEDIDMVIGTTVTADTVTPSLACLVAMELKLEGKICVDLNVACAGFVYAMDMADRYLKTEPEMKHVLIVSSEMLSRTMDYTDRSTCVLFGDGAGATVVTRSDKPLISYFNSVPSGADRVFCKGVTPKTPFITKEFNWGLDSFQNATDHQMTQAGSDVYRFATVAMPNAVKAVCEKAAVDVHSLKWIVPHQANLRIIQTAVKRLKVNEEQVYTNMDKYGNISSACIPVALDELIAEGRLQTGDQICLVGFGAGLTYGAIIFTV